MSDPQRSLQVGKQLQLVIAAADDLPRHLEPVRARRARRSTKIAAGVGAATSAAVGGVMWMANVGFWASVGAALGVAALPLVVTVGAGGLALGYGRRRAKDDAYAREKAQVELTLAAFQRMAEADGRISDEERTMLSSVLLRYPLDEEDRTRLEQHGPGDDVIAAAKAMDEAVRRQVARGAWMLAEADGVSPEEEVVFDALCGELGLAAEARELKRESRELQATMNDLVTQMFRSCQHVLEPRLGQAQVNEFLEALASIAATPSARRSLRNSLTSGFSAGGVARTLDQHGAPQKLMAQAYNAVRATCGLELDMRKAGRTRLLELADSTSRGRGEARRIAADFDVLFDEALASASAASDDAGEPS